jgi:transcriptional regulator with XRE-family HTH domain
MAAKRVGVNIKRLRETRGLTQVVLARRAKLHRVSLAKIESQTLSPTLATLDRIAKALGVRTAELLE